MEHWHQGFMQKMLFFIIRTLGTNGGTGFAYEYGGLMDFQWKKE